jgi:DNA-binding CsgD family transcriptional regulator
MRTEIVPSAETDKGVPCPLGLAGTKNWGRYGTGAPLARPHWPSGSMKTLSELEIHYLGQIAVGKTLHDIALDDDIPVSLIADALNSAEGKLGATNLMDAVTKAMLLGLLPQSAGEDDAKD